MSEPIYKALDPLSAFASLLGDAVFLTQAFAAEENVTDDDAQGYLHAIDGINAQIQSIVSATFLAITSGAQRRIPDHVLRDHIEYLKTKPELPQEDRLNKMFSAMEQFGFTIPGPGEHTDECDGECGDDGA